MASHVQGSLTVGQGFTTARMILVAAVQGLFKAVTHSAVYRKYNWPFKQIFGISFIQSMRILQRQSWFHKLRPPTGVQLLKECRARQLSVISHKLPSTACADSTLHQVVLGQRPDAPVLLYFHGGGYYAPLAGGAHLPLAVECAEQVGASSLFVLEYTLTPEAKHPSQLRQAALALEFLLHDAKPSYRPSQIIVAGDSAGGNMVFALMAHLIRPHPDIAAVKVPAGQKLKAALGISPWTSLDVSFKSYHRNGHTDMVDREQMEFFTELWAPTKEVWADMLEGDEAFWSGIPVEKILLTAGTLECFHDQVLRLHELLRGAQKNGVEVRLVEAEGEIHVHALVDTATKCGHNKSKRAMLEWFGEMKDI